MQGLIVEFTSVIVGELRQADGCQVANGNLILVSVLQDLSAEVGALDRTEVLLVGLVVAVVFVEHVGCTGLDLGINDLVPQPDSLNCLSAFARLLVTLVELFELGTVAFEEAGALVRAHESPITVGLDSFHEEIRDPQSVEQISCTVLFSTVVLSELQEINDVCMPRLQVDREGALALAATLVHVASRVVVHFKHGHQTIAVAVGAADVAVTGADAMNSKADAAGELADHSALL